MCDEDPLTKDDMQFTVLFNIARIRPGERVREKFALKSEVRFENTWNYLLSMLASVLDRIWVCIINISSSQLSLW